jgi:hypothetical protein
MVAKETKAKETNWSASVSLETMNQMAEIIGRAPIHYKELEKHVGKSASWVRYAINKMIALGRASELTNLRAYRRGTKIEVDYVQNIEKNREKAAQVEATRKKQESEPVLCRWCGLSGQLVGQSNGRRRTVCDSCQVDHDLSQNNPDHTRAWRDDRRWKLIIAKRHQERGGCLVCGSSRSKERDGRYCDWRHDPVMLSASEMEALLERYAAQETRYDIWGNVLR